MSAQLPCRLPRTSDLIQAKTDFEMRTKRAKIEETKMVEAIQDLRHKLMNDERELETINDRIEVVHAFIPRFKVRFWAETMGVPPTILPR